MNRAISAMYEKQIISQSVSLQLPLDNCLYASKHGPNEEHHQHQSPLLSPAPIMVQLAKTLLPGCEYLRAQFLFKYQIYPIDALAPYRLPHLRWLQMRWATLLSDHLGFLFFLHQSSKKQRDAKVITYVVARYPASSTPPYRLFACVVKLLPFTQSALEDGATRMSCSPGSSKIILSSCATVTLECTLPAPVQSTVPTITGFKLSHEGSELCMTCVARGSTI